MAEIAIRSAHSACLVHGASLGFKSNLIGSGPGPEFICIAELFSQSAVCVCVLANEFIERKVKTSKFAPTLLQPATSDKQISSDSN